jgi:hypothetical protein
VTGVIADSGFYLKQFIERLEEEKLTYIIAVRLIRPLQRQIYARADWKMIAKGIGVLLRPSSLGQRETVYRGETAHHPGEEGDGEDFTPFCQ